MKLTTRDIVYLYDTIGQISEQDGIENAPADIKFLLVRNARSLQPVWAEFNEARRTLLLDNSEPTEDDSESRKATPEQLRFINEEIVKLEKVEVEVAIAPIPLAKLEPLNLGIQELNGLYPIIADGEAY